MRTKKIKATSSVLTSLEGVQLVRKSVVAGVFFLCAAVAQAAEFESLFNGKDLSGWAGQEGLWSVQRNSKYEIGHQKVGISEI